MGFKKIPKDVWLRMPDKEKEYYALEFKKSVEKRLRLTIIVTRIIAVFCVAALFGVGFVQFKAVEEYGQIKDQYGSEAFCYLCGLESLKKCECQYISGYGFNEDILDNLDNYSISLAEYNIKNCGSEVQNGSQQYAGIIIDIN